MAYVMNKRTSGGATAKKPTAKVTYKNLGGTAAKIVAKPRTGSGTITSGTKTATPRKKY